MTKDKRAGSPGTPSGAARPSRGSTPTALLALTTMFVAAATTPALAAGSGLDDGADRGAEIGVGTAVLLYAVVPTVLLLLIAALVWLPNVIKSKRYRPQRGWAAAPVWFAGPADPVAAVQAAEPGAAVRGGASGSW